MNPRSTSLKTTIHGHSPRPMRNLLPQSVNQRMHAAVHQSNGPGCLGEPSSRGVALHAYTADPDKQQNNTVRSSYALWPCHHLSVATCDAGVGQAAQLAYTQEQKQGSGFTAVPEVHGWPDACSRQRPSSQCIPSSTCAAAAAAAVAAAVGLHAPILERMA